MSNVIHTLPQIQWRGLTAWASEIQTSFAHGLPEIPYAYVDGDGHQWTGRRSIRTQATLHFLTTIEPDLYPVRWNTWRGALLDGSAGELLHPDLGVMRARPAEGSYAISARQTAGVVVQVSFVETVEDPSEASEFSAPEADVVEAAEQVDAAMEELGIDYPTGEPDSNLVSSVKGALGEITQAANQVSGKLNKVKGTINQIRSAHERAMKAVLHADAATRDAVAGAPARWVLEANLDILETQLETMQEVASRNARTIKSLTVASPSTLAALQAQTENDLGDLLSLNQGLLGGPAIPSGSTVRYFARL